MAGAPWALLCLLCCAAWARQTTGACVRRLTRRGRCSVGRPARQRGATRPANGAHSHTRVTPPPPPPPQPWSAVRGAFLDYVDDPFYVAEDKAVRYGGRARLARLPCCARRAARAAALGPLTSPPPPSARTKSPTGCWWFRTRARSSPLGSTYVAGKFPGVPTTTYKDGNIIMPGFIDTHVHYVQSRVTGAYGLHKCVQRGRCRAWAHVRAAGGGGSVRFPPPEGGAAREPRGRGARGQVAHSTPCPPPPTRVRRPEW